MPRWVFCAVFACAIAAAGAASASENGQVAADQVNLASYQDFLNTYLYTHVGHNRRYNGPQHDPARDNILALFQSYGLNAWFETFSYSGGTQENVVAEMVGAVYPERIYIIGGHYDSVGNPGADDNASGVGAVLEAARILSQYPSDCTIRFIAFDVEEQGLIGSEDYVDAHYLEDIRGMISLDMVAYDPNTNQCNIYGRTASNPIKSAFAAAVYAYGDGLIPLIGGDTPYSDHAPFEEAGFQACLLIEGEVWNNPFYHTQQDSYEQPGNLNFPYAVKMTRSTVGWLVDAAGVQVESLRFSYPDGLPGPYVAPAGGALIRVEVTGIGLGVPVAGTGMFHYAWWSGAPYESVPMEVVAENIYEIALPAVPCGATLHYFFSAEMASGGTRSDPPGAPNDTYSSLSGFGRVVWYAEDLDSDPGWLGEGQWAFGPPTGGGSHNRDPHAGYSGANVVGYNLSGDYSNSMPAHYLTTTSIDCTNTYDIELFFWRWLGVDRFDSATLELSDNGGLSWQVLWSAAAEGVTIADPGWTEMHFVLPESVENNPDVRLRWGMGPTDSLVTYPGWNIDDVRLESLSCTAPFTPGDTNCDGQINALDINPFVLALTDPDAYAAQNPLCDINSADVNQDLAINALDINPFVRLLTAD